MNKIILLMLITFTLYAHSDNDELNCHEPRNTMQINQCASQALSDAKNRMEFYYITSLKHNSSDSMLIKAIEHSQVSWEQYLTDQCSAVYTQWRDGTIRGVMSLSCKTTLTNQRTYQLWNDFLTFVDGTDSVLPKPVF